ncbi:MAG: hypothetical protein ACRDHM_10115, partial [Actinomycetota bacterium]
MRTVRFRLIDTLHVSSVDISQPAHSTPAGLALRVTFVLVTKVSVQSEGQEMPVGRLVTRLPS